MSDAKTLAARAAPGAVGDARPWYRQVWPWLLISGPAAVIVAGFATLYIAISTDDGVVAEDYYRRGLLINKSLERDARAVAAQLGAVVRVDGSGAVSVELGAPATFATPDAITFRLIHATRAGLDRVTTLRRDSDGAYRGRVEAPPVGRWLVTVETDGWRIPVEEISGQPTEIRLGTARAPR